MACQFKRRESVRKGVRRLACKRIRKALDSLEHCTEAEVVHSVRKDIKQLRGLLRLVRSGIKKQEYRRYIKCLREAAGHLGAIRDAYVRLNALRDLTARFKRRVAPAAFRQLRRSLNEKLQDEATRFRKRKASAKAGKLLRGLLKDAEKLQVSGKTWKALAPGIEQSYSQGAAALKYARENSSALNLHEWRKAAKDLWYQIRFLRPIWPEQMDAMAHDLRELTEYLGDDHDLVMLAESATDFRKCFGDSNAAETLNALINQRQTELRPTALALGARFYAEKPARFCNRLRGYWQIWRGEKRRALAALQ